MQSTTERSEQRRILLILAKQIAQAQNFGKCEIQIEDVDFGGANVTSDVFSVKITEQGKQDLHLFAKILTMADFDSQIEGLPRPFTTELCFYTTVMKKFERLEELFDLPKEYRLIVPQFYASNDKFPSETLILEDLTAQGFKSFNREKCIDLEQAITAIEVLAKFHALSLACYKYNLQDFEDILKQMPPKTAGLEKLFHIMKPRLLANVNKVCTNENRQSMEKYFSERDRFSEFANLFYCSKGRHTLVHGDFKLCNLMYRHHNDKLEMALMDFQFTSPANPVTDVVFLLVSSADEQFRRQHYHALLDLYYEQLQLALGRLHVDPEEVYSEETYHEDVKQLGTAGLMLGVVWLPTLLAAARGAAPSALYRRRFNGLVNNYREWGLLT